MNQWPLMNAKRTYSTVESGEDIVNLHRNNGRKPKFEEFWQVRQDKKTLGRRVISLSYFLKLIFHFVYNFGK